jgi:hypothetical protein
MYRIVTEMNYNKLKELFKAMETEPNAGFRVEIRKKIIDQLNSLSTLEKEEFETILNALVDLKIEEALQEKIKTIVLQNE